jgi:hypothetical protein
MNDHVAAFASVRTGETMVRRVPARQEATRRARRQTISVDCRRQFNMNMPGSTGRIPIADCGWLNSALINTFDFWHMYPVDEWNGGRPAHFGATVHNVDEEFYDRYYHEGYVNDRICGRSRIWGE